MSQLYFASKATEEIGKELSQKLEYYREFLRNSGLLSELRKSYKLYYGNSAIQDIDGSKVGIQVNHYANLLRHIHSMVTSTRPAFDARAVNSDYESQADTQLANSLLDYYLREKRLEDHLKNATEYALYLREGWICVSWAPTSGEAYAINPDNNQPIYEGDVEFKTLSILDVARDVNNKSGVQDWYITSEQKNKWDLAAKYPELAEQITSMSDKSDNTIVDELNLSYSMTSSKNNESDLVQLHTFYHKKSEAMPQGRMVQFLSHDIVLFDGPLPYKKVYLFKITASDAFQTAFGHSPGFDLIPLQDALDSTFSIILSNHNAFGSQNIMAPKGSGIGVQQIAEGLNLIEFDKQAGPPQPLNLVQTPAEIFNFATMLIQQQETISGVNSVARGNAPASLSGSAMALISSQALAFSSGVQQSYNALLENVGSSLIELLQTFAVVPRIAMIAGKTNKSMMKEFKNTDLQNVSRVVVDSANPLTKSTAGRVQIADNLLNTGLIKTPQEYLSVISTGNLQPLLEHENSQNLLVRQENEWLSEGKQLQAVICDDHSLHVLSHSVVLNSPEARLNQQIVETTLSHIQEHINLAKTMDPVLAQMLKFQPLQIPQAPPTGSNPEVMNTQMPLAQEAAGVNLPSMPKIAGTNERFDPTQQ